VEKNGTDKTFIAVTFTGRNAPPPHADGSGRAP
jgi:hypothetical protein